MKNTQISIKSTLSDGSPKQGASSYKVEEQNEVFLFLNREKKITKTLNLIIQEKVTKLTQFLLKLNVRWI